MNPTTIDEPAATPLSAAVDAVEDAVEQLIKLVDDGALGDLGAFGLSRHCSTSRRYGTSCRWWIGR